MSLPWRSAVAPLAAVAFPTVDGLLLLHGSFAAGESAAADFVLQHFLVSTEGFDVF